MLYFPQLQTGAPGQYPLMRRRRVRAVVNECGDGRQVKYADSGATEMEWVLRLEGLTEGERQELEGLFDAVKGRLKTFVFLDPLENLLRHSGDLSEAVWAKDALLAVDGGSADVWGGDDGWRVSNSGQTAQGLAQTLPASGRHQYCFSAYLRSDAGCVVRLVRRSGGAEEAAAVTVGGNWERVKAAGSIAAGGDGISFGLEIDSGGVVEVCGLQVECQPGETSYKKTLACGGVYTEARFAQDQLEWLTTGVDAHSTVLRIRSRVQE